MPHNLTVTVEDPLWDEMKKHPEVRWSIVMKEAAKEKLHALTILETFAQKSKLSEGDINKFAVKLGKVISHRR